MNYVDSVKGPFGARNIPPSCIFCKLAPKKTTQNTFSVVSN